MKVVNAQEMARIEKLSYQDHGKEQAQAFMEKAGYEVAKFMLPAQNQGSKVAEKKVLLLCGKGNNAGDAYVAGRYLQEQGFSVTALQLFPISSASPLAKMNYEKFTWVKGTVVPPEECLDFKFPKNALIIDGLLGTGFRGELEAPLSTMIQKANASGLPILAVDVPSGMDASEGVLGDSDVINAKWTIALGLPKTGFFLRDSWNVLGRLTVVSFGLASSYVRHAKEDFYLLSEKRVSRLLPPIRRNRHKYQRGALAILAGSPGMAGASLLTSYAALRGGAGIVRLLHPSEIRTELALAPIELLKVSYEAKLNERARSQLLNTLNASKAVVLGPGLGLGDSARSLVKYILPRLEVPLVLDADGLNILAEEKCPLPLHTVLTPHAGEMARLLGLEKAPARSLEFLHLCQKYAEEKSCTILLKGAPTFILHPGKVPYVCIKGDPGMATAGSGDVLAGMVGALLAQGLRTRDAALLGAYLHGLAGELAAHAKTSYAMIASDIIEAIPRAYSKLQTLIS